MDPTAAPPPVSAARGETVIRDRVWQRLAEHAALTVPDVVRQTGLLPGRALPAVLVAHGDTGTVVSVTVAAAWPCAVAYPAAVSCAGGAALWYCAAYAW